MKKFSSYIQEKKNDFLEEAENFVKFACEWLELDEPPAIYLSDNKRHAVAQKSFGGYSPSDKDIRVNIAERHKVDVFRTLAHELVHYRQDIDGRLDEDSGQTGSEIENEANAVAGIIMREYARATNGAIFEEYEVEIQEQEFLAEGGKDRHWFHDNLAKVGIDHNLLTDQEYMHVSNMHTEHGIAGIKSWAKQRIEDLKKRKVLKKSS